MKKLFSFLLVTLMLLSPFATCVNADSIVEQAIDTTNAHEFGRVGFTFSCCNSPDLVELSGATYCNNCRENLYS